MLCALAAGCGPPEQEALDRVGAPIIGGQATSGFPSVGSLLVGTTSGGALCTATLIGKKTVLTAAHCLKTLTTPHNFYLGRVKYAATKVTTHPDWDPTDKSYPNDIGVVQLATAPGVKPSLLSTKAPKVGMKLTLVGYGETQDGKGDYGTKRVGTNTIAQVYQKAFSFKGTGSTCKGDSGGPAFATVDGRTELVGVTSSGYSPCGNTAFDTRVDYFASWVAKTANYDIYRADSTKPKVSITSPKDGATVAKKFTLEVSASDNSGVDKVAVLVDGKRAGEKSSSPYTFHMQLSLGRTVIAARAYDYDGNSATAQITVTVSDTPTATGGKFGATCKTRDDCASNLCARDGEASFCTQKCTPNKGDCPQGAPCVSASGQSVCGRAPLAATPSDPGVLQGGCTYSGSAPLGGWPWIISVLLVVVALVPLHRRNLLR